MGACFHYRSQENARRRPRQGSFGFSHRMSPTSTEIVALPAQLLSSSLSLSPSLSLSLSLFSLSLSLSLSRMQTHTHTHTRRDHCCCSFFSRVISHLSCGMLDIRLPLSFHCDTHRHSFFQAGVPLFHPLTKFFSNQRQSFFTSVKGLAKSKSRSTHARTRPRPPNCQLARHNKRAYEITAQWSLAFFTEA